MSSRILILTSQSRAVLFHALPLTDPDYAYSSDSALDRYARLERPALVIVDLFSPCMDCALSFADWVRDVKPTLPVIFIGPEDVKVRIRAAECGAGGYVTEMDELPSMISGLL